MLGLALFILAQDLYYFIGSLNNSSISNESSFLARLFWGSFNSFEKYGSAYPIVFYNSRSLIITEFLGPVAIPFAFLFIDKLLPYFIY